MAFGSNSNRQQFVCLYTRHKTQKHKVWHDGRLVLTSGNKVMLHDANPKLGSSDPVLDQCEIAPNQRQGLLQSCSGQMIEMEKFLVEVDAPWTTTTTAATSVVVNTAAPLIKPAATLQKLMTSKFQKPKAYIPPHPSQRPSRVETVLGKRRRPLQPGEVLQMHYGGQEPQQNSNAVPMVPPSRQIPPGYGPPGTMMSNHATQGVFGPPTMRVPPMQQQPNSGGCTVQPQQNPGNQPSYIPSNQSTSINGAMTIMLQAPRGPQSFGLPPPGPQRPEQPRTFGAQQVKPNTSNSASNTNNNADVFSNNGFNANEFYGSEEEEEDDEDEREPVQKPFGPTWPESFRPTQLLPPQQMSHSEPRPFSNNDGSEINRVSHPPQDQPTGAPTRPSEPVQSTSRQQQPPNQQPKTFHLGTDSDSDSDDDDCGGGGPKSFRPSHGAASNPPSNKPRTGTDILALFGMAGEDDTASQGGHDGSLVGATSQTLPEESTNTSIVGKENATNTTQIATKDNEQQQPSLFSLAPAEASSEESSDDDI